MESRLLALTASEPSHATLFVVDVVGFGALANPAQLAVRNALYEMLSTSFDTGGVPWGECHREDRGDGALVAVPGTVSKTLVLDRVLGGLIEAVAAQGAGGLIPLRLKVAIHAGEVHRDVNGLVGFDVNHAFRLLESELVRYAIRTSSAMCAVIASDSIYQSVIRHGYGSVAPGEYARARVVNKEDDSVAWLRLPGAPRGALKAVRKFAQEQAEPQASRGGVIIRANGEVGMRSSIIAGRDAVVNEQHD